MAEPRDPWSDNQLQSNPAGPRDTAPWRLTFAVIAALVLLMLAAYFIRHQRAAETYPSPPASVR